MSVYTRHEASPLRRRPTTTRGIGDGLICASSLSNALRGEEEELRTRNRSIEIAGDGVETLLCTRPCLGMVRPTARLLSAVAAELPAALRHRYFAVRHGQSLANVEGVVSSHPDVAPFQHGLTDTGKEQVRASASALPLEHYAVVSSDYLRAAETAELLHRGVCRRLSARAAAREGDPGALRYDPRYDPPSRWTWDGLPDFCPRLVRPRLLAAIPYQPDVEPLIAAKSRESFGLPPEESWHPRRCKALRERWFGELDGGADTRYAEVWEADARDAGSEAFGAESVLSVRNRTVEFVRWLDGALPVPASDPGLRYNVMLCAHGDVLQILQTAFKRADPRKHRSFEHLENAEVRELELELS